MLSNFVSIASLQGSKGNSVPPSEGLISLESLESGDSLTAEKPAKGQFTIHLCFTECIIPVAELIRKSCSGYFVSAPLDVLNNLAQLFRADIFVLDGAK